MIKPDQLKYAMRSITIRITIRRIPISFSKAPTVDLISGSYECQAYNLFSFKVVKILKKINNIYSFKGIFVFSHLQFDGVRAQTDGSSMENTKKLE